MRGTPLLVIVLADNSRIIPADAGNTISGDVILLYDRDHPLGCGEHWSLSKGMSLRLGSSPRMRGTPSAPALR